MKNYRIIHLIFQVFVFDQVQLLVIGLKMLVFDKVMLDDKDQSLTIEYQLKDVYEILSEINEQDQIIGRNIFVHDNKKQDNVHMQHNHHLIKAKVERKRFKKVKY